jgi:hypothetical protein
MKNANGGVARGFIEIDTLGFNNFQSLFKEVEKVKMGKILKLISYFPRLIKEEDNRDFFYEVTKDEL